MRNNLIIAIAITLMSSICMALGEEWIGTVAVVKRDVWLRESPPKGLFCKKGKKIQAVKKDEKIKVLRHISISCAVFFSYDWLEVERLGVELDVDKKIGYVGVKSKKGNQLVAPYSEKTGEN